MMLSPGYEEDLCWLNQDSGKPESDSVPGGGGLPLPLGIPQMSSCIQVWPQLAPVQRRSPVLPGARSSQCFWTLYLNLTFFLKLLQYLLAWWILPSPHRHLQRAWGGVSWLTLPWKRVLLELRKLYIYIYIYSIFAISKAYGTLPDDQYAYSKYLWTWR
jgi:hypothetical protein